MDDVDAGRAGRAPGKRTLTVRRRCTVPQSERAPGVRPQPRHWPVAQIFDWMVYEHELQPRERLLEYGSGALSSGIWFIEYLQPGNYYGMEAVKWLYDAGVEYEVPLHMLEDKHPNLLHNPEEELEPAGVPRRRGPGGATEDHVCVPFLRLVHSPPPPSHSDSSVRTRHGAMKQGQCGCSVGTTN